MARDGRRGLRRWAGQRCDGLAHLLRPLPGAAGRHQAGQAKTSQAVRRILQAGLAARDARDAGELDRAQAAAEAKRLGAQVDKPIAGRTVYPPNRRLLGHLGRERDALLTFVSKSEVQATERGFVGLTTYQALRELQLLLHLRIRGADLSAARQYGGGPCIGGLLLAAPPLSMTLGGIILTRLLQPAVRLRLIAPLALLSCGVLIALGDPAAVSRPHDSRRRRARCRLRSRSTRSSAERYRLRTGVGRSG
jgi:hypothetical protein